jgi:hypothetical protein
VSRRRRALVDSSGEGRHLQHRRGAGEVKGKTIWLENCSKVAVALILMASVALRQQDADMRQGGWGCSWCGPCEEKAGMGRKLLAGDDCHLLTMGGGAVGVAWRWRHAAEEDVGGLARSSGGAIGRQRPDPGGSGQAACGRLASAEQGRLGHR